MLELGPVLGLERLEWARSGTGSFHGPFGFGFFLGGGGMDSILTWAKSGMLQPILAGTEQN